MSLASDHVTVFRDQWADRFVDVCNVYRLSARGSINATTLQYDSETEPPVAANQACLFRPKTQTPSVSEFGGQGVGYLAAEIYFPHDAPELQVEDTVILASSISSPKLVGKSYRITSVEFDSYQTRMKCELERSQGPGETN